MLDKQWTLCAPRQGGDVCTVDSLITHTFQWTAQGMGFQGVWASRSGQTKAKQIKYYVKIQKRVRKQTHSRGPRDLNIITGSVNFFKACT